MQSHLFIAHMKIHQIYNSLRSHVTGAVTN